MRESIFSTPTPDSALKKENDQCEYPASRYEGFAPEDRERLLEQYEHGCWICGQEHISDANSTGEDVLEPHMVMPLEKGGVPEKENGTILCKGCHDRVHKTADMAPRGNDRLSKAQKRRLWKGRGGMFCEVCGRQGVGGRTVGIHPFKPADWDGEMSSIRTLCATCLGQEASKRNKIEKLATSLRLPGKEQ